MATTIVLTHELQLRSSDICDSHEGWPLHAFSEHDQLAGLVPYSEDVRCSVCGLSWGRGAVSQHLRCEALMSDGSRRGSRAISYWTRAGGETVEIVYTDPYEG